MKTLFTRFAQVAALLALGIFSTGAPALGQHSAEALYKSKCAMCHAADGSGTAIGKKMGARDFASPEVQKQTDAELAEVTSKGKNKMPAYAKSLKESQIKDLVAYCRELGKKKK